MFLAHASNKIEFAVKMLIPCDPPEINTTTTNTKCMKNPFDWDQKIVILLIIVVIGAILRLYNLNANSLWLDEGATYYFSSHSLVEIYKSVSLGEFNPPLFYWIAHFLLKIITPADLALRVVPVVAGIATIPVVYLIGKELYSQKIGLIAALFIAVSPWHVLYSQEGRAYTLAILFFAISLYYVSKRIQFPEWATLDETLLLINRNYKKETLLIGIFAALSFWSHFFSLTFIVPMFLLLLIYKRKSAFYVILTFAVLTWPIFIEFLKLAINYKTISNAVSIPYGIGIIYQPGVEAISYTFANLGEANIVLGGVAMAAVLIGTYVLFAKNEKSGALIAAVSIIPFVILEFALLKMAVAPRYMGYLVVPLSIQLAAMVSFFKTNKTTVYCFAMLAILIGFSFSSTIALYKSPMKPDWRSTSVFLKETAAPGSTVVIIGFSYEWLPIHVYYNNQTQGTVMLSVDNLKGLSRSWPAGTYFVAPMGELAFLDGNGQMQQWFDTNTRLINETWGMKTYKS